MVQYSRKTRVHSALLWVLAFVLSPLITAAVAAAQKFADDGAAQSPTGAWSPDWGYCAQGPPAASATRYDCRSFILSAGTNVPGNPYYDPSFDTQVECIAPAATPGGPAEWSGSATCTNYWYGSNAATCVANGGMWLTNICRGRWRWNPEAPASNLANYRDNCTRCHNQRYFPLSELALAESYLATGHKNMLRPVAPVGNDDPHYATNAPWAGADGTIYATDSSGNPIDFSTGTIVVGGVTKTLYWIYDGWIASSPRALASGGTYGCARCHTTGWSADATMVTSKEPYAMFGDYTGLFSTAGDGQPYTSWDEWGIQCSRCHGSQIALATPDVRHFPDIPGKEAVGGLSTGATRTALCMDCHRQESGGAPYDPGDPGGVLKVGPSHETVEFLSHWHGNQFLNSPHALFTGSFAQINDKAFYDSFFRYEGEGYPLSGNAGGCTQCHDVHRSTVEAANPDGGAIRETCTACHFKTLGAIRHPTGPGTPIASKYYPDEACLSCHMPEGLHLFRISVDEGYATFPAGALGAAANANTTADGAVWVDLDHACGQCHGGGSAQAITAGTVAAGSKALAVVDPTDFAAGERVEIAGAGAGGAPFRTYVASVAGSTVNLVGKASLGVTDAEVVLNPSSSEAPYFDREQLAGYALGMHDDKPEVYFSYRLGNPNTLQVLVDATATTCSGSPANCDLYEWSWGDGSPDGTGLTATHLYAAAGTYPITLTVTEYAIGSASRTLDVTVYAPDAPPVVNGSCSVAANTWVATVTDVPPATDDHGVAQIVVNWGDGGLVNSDTTPPFGPFTHTYLNAGSYTVSRRVIDTIGQQTIDTSCVLTVAPFSIGGTVYQSNGSTPVNAATVTIKKGLVTVRTLVTDASGAYSATALKPGLYGVTAKRTGYTFSATPIGATLGPSAPAVDVVALAP